MPIVLSIVLILLVVAAALIDFVWHIIPNKITGLGAILAIVMGALINAPGEPERLIAGVAAGGFLLLAAFASPGGMGMGDVKLAGMMGLLLGPTVVVAIFVALFSGMFAGIAIAAYTRTKIRNKGVPLGPFLAFGSLVAVFYGQPIMHIYFNHFLH
jgi:leader peptidase (prepilin peptidase)/N-methyltransferase